MNDPIHIALLLQGGRGWLGGLEYIKGILSAINAVPAEERARFRVTLVTPERLSEADQKQFGSLADHLLCLAEEMPTASFAQRLFRKVAGRLLRVTFSPHRAFLERQRFDFVYPYTPEKTEKTGFAFASWIFDFQHKHLPEFFSPEELHWRDRFFERCARLSPLVVLSSRDAEHDFQRYYPAAASKARVFSFATPSNDSWYKDDPAETQRRYALPDRFFLVANQFWKHKNHPVVFRAIKLLADRGVCPTVVFTGSLVDGRSPEYTDTVLQTIQQLGIHSQVRLLGIVPKAHYVQVLRRCIAVIQPSLFEGWSTIVEDCRSLRKPMLLSDLEVHREQNPPGVTFFPRTDEQELAAQMQHAWENFPEGPDLQAEGEARETNSQRMQELGKQFLEIVAEAVPRANA